jgi:hypothetical protein
MTEGSGPWDDDCRHCPFCLSGTPLQQRVDEIHAMVTSLGNTDRNKLQEQDFVRRIDEMFADFISPTGKGPLSRLLKDIRSHFLTVTAPSPEAE